MKLVASLLFVFTVLAHPAYAQVGNLLWSEDFDDLDDWLIATGNGSWGWGNGELEYYSQDNVDIASVPGEPGNTALRITARQESGPEIVDQVTTSGTGDIVATLSGMTADTAR